ncbi:MAG: DUF1501 domain-containing protein [Pseudomonadota bacterium]
MISRRVLLAGIGAATFAGPMARAAQPKAKLILVVLRGAMDGLGVVPKLDDPYLGEHRKALIPSKTLSLTDGFALDAHLTALHQWFLAGEASIVHAISGPWRDRSHFLSQDLLESGGVTAAGRTGWLNRALSVHSSLSAVSIGPAQPLILKGSAQTSSWSPPVLPPASPDTIARLMDMYAADPILQQALGQAIATNAMTQTTKSGMRGGGEQGFAKHMAAAARLMTAPGGPNIAVVCMDGWDTHSAQIGRLGRSLRALNEGLIAGRSALKETWEDTVIACVTEFGRTVRDNGAKGTDHGTAGAAFLAGGALKTAGGKMLGDWPGLAPGALYQNRDLYPANDLHALFKGLLTQLYGFDAPGLSKVFPDTRGGPVMRLA